MNKTLTAVFKELSASITPSVSSIHFKEDTETDYKEVVEAVKKIFRAKEKFVTPAGSIHLTCHLGEVVITTLHKEVIVSFHYIDK